MQLKIPGGIDEIYYPHTVPQQPVSITIHWLNTSRHATALGSGYQSANVTYCMEHRQLIIPLTAAVPRHQIQKYLIKTQ